MRIQFPADGLHLLLSVFVFLDTSDIDHFTVTHCPFVLLQLEMSGFEVAGLILAVYPLLVNTVYVYKAAKSSQAVDQLARKLKTEATIYKQFTTKLLACVSLQEVNQEAWQDENLQSQLMESLGSDRAELVLQDLHEMDELLKTLNTEISNMNRSSVGSYPPTWIPNENHRRITDQQTGSVRKAQVETQSLYGKHERI